jgi:hypothetical protein
LSSKAETVVVAKTAPATFCSEDLNLEFIFNDVVLVGKIDSDELGSDEYVIWDIVWIVIILWPVAEVIDEFVEVLSLCHGPFNVHCITLLSLHDSSCRGIREDFLPSSSVIYASVRIVGPVEEEQLCLHFTVRLSDWHCIDYE